jgi:hypothetical protein
MRRATAWRERYYICPTSRDVTFVQPLEADEMNYPAATRIHELKSMHMLKCTPIAVTTTRTIKV